MYCRAIAHDAEIKSVLRAYQQALTALQRLDRARVKFRSTLLDAQEAGATKSELGRALGISRQRVDEVLARARHERAAGAEDVTD
jgi:DNA-directed RNA polymerase sigma subunit (sigma70/sigma32)